MKLLKSSLILLFILTTLSIAQQSKSINLPYFIGGEIDFISSTEYHYVQNTKLMSTTPLDSYKLFGVALGRRFILKNNFTRIELRGAFAGGSSKDEHKRSYKKLTIDGSLHFIKRFSPQVHGYTIMGGGLTTTFVRYYYTDFDNSEQEYFKEPIKTSSPFAKGGAGIDYHFTEKSGISFAVTYRYMKMSSFVDPRDFLTPLQMKEWGHGVTGELLLIKKF